MKGTTLRLNEFEDRTTPAMSSFGGTSLLASSAAAQFQLPAIAAPSFTMPTFTMPTFAARSRVNDVDFESDFIVGRVDQREVASFEASIAKHARISLPAFTGSFSLPVLSSGVPATTPAPVTPAVPVTTPSTTPTTGNGLPSTVPSAGTGLPSITPTLPTAPTVGGTTTGSTLGTSTSPSGLTSLNSGLTPGTSPMLTGYFPALDRPRRLT